MNEKINKFTFDKNSPLRITKEQNLKLQNLFQQKLICELNIEEITNDLNLSLRDSLQLLRSFGMPVDTGKKPLSAEFNGKLLQTIYREKLTDYLVYGIMRKEDTAFLTKVIELASKK